ncbi:hypothetical protein B0H19DRAFT_184303 [Mycena capillaripes]|nr:hypothetical protein B0H19DRAFT_184303 [Mycena capillaripes]
MTKLMTQRRREGGELSTPRKRAQTCIPGGHKSGGGRTDPNSRGHVGKKVNLRRSQDLAERLGTTLTPFQGTTAELTRRSRPSQGAREPQ